MNTAVQRAVLNYFLRRGDLAQAPAFDIWEMTRYDEYDGDPYQFAEAVSNGLQGFTVKPDACDVSRPIIGREGQPVAVKDLVLGDQILTDQGIGILVWSSRCVDLYDLDIFHGPGSTQTLLDVRRNETFEVLRLPEDQKPYTLFAGLAEWCLQIFQAAFAEGIEPKSITGDQDGTIWVNERYMVMFQAGFDAPVWLADCSVENGAIHENWTTRRDCQRCVSRRESNHAF